MIEKPGTRAWYYERIGRHLNQIAHIAWPSVLSRLGILGMATVDTVMVGQYATNELAYLNLGTGTFVMLFLIMAMGLLIGTLVYTADAYGREDFEECGRVWRRSLPYAAILGFLCLIICLPGEQWFLAFGQTPEVAREGGMVMSILSFGLFAHLIYFTSVSFLEGVERPRVAMYIMVFANIANVGLNYILIYGAFGIPAMGAQGAALTTTVMRIFLAVSVVIYILNAPSLKKYKPNAPWMGKWADWKVQRVMGYAAGISLGAEVAAFGFMNILAGWMGTFQLAAWGILFNLMGLLFMIPAGVGTAASVRVGIAKSRHDPIDASLAGWVSFAIAAVLLFIFGLPLWISPENVVGLYTSDTNVWTYVIPSMALVAISMMFDGGQAVMSNALRGMGETWGPTVIQGFSFLVVMLPLSYYLGFTLDHGIVGLMEATIIACFLSATLLGLWFQRQIKRVIIPKI